jgi:hypothetical protein
MAFLVYFFVLLVAAGSVIFGLDWTQAPLNPPPYATPPAQTAAVTPAPATKPETPVSTKTVPATRIAKATDAVAKAPDSTVAKAPDTTTAPQATQAAVQPPATVPATDEATQAQARATDPAADTTASTTVAAAAHCNISACSSSYRSFRASDCTYQPMSGERRLCTKTATTGKIAAATHPRMTRRNEPRYDRRDAYDDGRRGYADERRGWGFDFFGGGSYADDR